LPNLKPSLTPEQIDIVRNSLRSLTVGLHCTIMHRTKTGKTRTVQGEYQGVVDNHVILRHNGRNNRVPIESMMRMTRPIEDG
jgi:hypothetical protein